MLRERWTRAHRSAISALSPAGKLYCACQACARNAEDVVALLEPLLREVPARMGLIWAGAPMHRRHVIRALWANGAAPRMHVGRLPAYAPERHPGEGLWAHLKGGELRQVCCLHLPHLRRELRDAGNRVRRKPRLIKGFFSGARR